MKKIIALIIVCIVMTVFATGCSVGPKVSPTPTPQVKEEVTPPPSSKPFVVLTSADQLWTYNLLDDGTAKIYTYEGTDTVAVVPSIIDGYTVSAIDSYGLCHKTRIYVAESRFECILTEVTIPSSINEIPIDLFANAESLTKINYDEDCDFTFVNNILYNKDQTILYFCTNKDIQSFEIPASVKTIAGGAFRNCQNLTSITIPSTVDTIGEYAFYNCISLKTVTLEEGVKAIYNQAFTNCINLERLTIPRSVDTMGLRTLSFTNILRICIYKDSYVDKFFQDNQETFNLGSAYIDYVEYIG